MNRINNKGFTLIELIATIVLIALVTGIGTYSITAIIKNSREKDYSLLIKNIQDAVELYYQECRFVNNNCVSELTLGNLLNDGFLKGNVSGSNLALMNPNNEEEITNCQIKYTYSNGKMIIESKGELSTCPPDKTCCPTTLDYSKN